MTLNDLINECALYADETTTSEFINKIKTSLNYAYKKICREKFNISLADMPTDLVNNSDTPAFSTDKVDHKLLCFYAVYQYLLIEDDEKANYWLNLWNDGFENITWENGAITSLDPTYDCL